AGTGPYPAAPSGDGNRRGDRLISINDFWSGIMSAKDPPVRMLWLSCRNPLVQDARPSLAREAMEKLDLVVVADLFLTATARAADLVLPVTTFFEECDLVMSYWHYWVSLNEQAIAPPGEAGSDLSIAAALAGVLNRFSPGSCRFPPVDDPAWWLDREMNAVMGRLLGINDWRELRAGPRKASLPVPWHDGEFETASGRIELFSPAALADGLPPLPVYIPPSGAPAGYPLRLLTPHFQHGLNSQFPPRGWLKELHPEPAFYINPQLARERGVVRGSTVRVFNGQGEVVLPVEISLLVPEGVVLFYQRPVARDDFAINVLIDPVETDMGRHAMGVPGAAFFEAFVDLEVLDN
ncbi:molybdopterin-dependent oxidoreductase, partial [Desulfotomaculum copahuensis]|uniref:molybdopterin-dependent oxidoreductase n=1 Tax=Desulfotomaculum copahuensis TaxID=1838280 RepID=UPI000ADEA48B